MTSKERARLRGLANTMEPLFQVGKGGIGDALIKQTDDALTARELIKLRVLLETSPEKPKDVAMALAEKTNSEVIGVIGGSIILYRYNEELHKKEKKKR
jgi:RNA-binding protein